MKWEYLPETESVTALTYSGHYVISHRPMMFNLCYRPLGEHHHLGTFDTLGAAIAKAEKHSVKFAEVSNAKPEFTKANSI